MTPPRESAIVAKIKRGLEADYGAWVIKTHGDGKRAGTPDLLWCVRGRFGATEVKSPGASRGVTARQQAELTRIERSGGLAFVARSMDDVHAQLEAVGLMRR